jgi:hypothetical protein
MNSKKIKIRYAIAAFSLLMIVFSACDTTPKDPKDGKDPVDKEPVVNVQDATEECATLQKGQFCISGFDFLKVGDSLLWNSKIDPSVEVVSIKDTVFEGYMDNGSTIDTTAWFVKMLEYPDGMVFLEQDFENPHLMGRIRIESAGYSHASGLKVGSSVKDIKANFLDIIPMPFEQYQVMDLVVPYSGKRMIFQVPLGDYYKAGKEEYNMDEIPDDLKVVRIVLM